MRYLYNLVFYLVAPFISLYLCWCSRKTDRYCLRWHERFAYFKIDKRWQHGLWVHAASVGEVRASIPLVKAIQRCYPKLPIVFTTMTPTGSTSVKAHFANSVFHIYMPYDLPTVVKRFLNRTRPRAVMILETELWPNILHQCRCQNIPVMLANARLSEKSYRRYVYFSATIKKMLDGVTVLAAHASVDAERFIALGIDANRVNVTGSIKFEIEVPHGILQQAQMLRHSLGENRPVWVAASTHSGEEEQILKAHRWVLAKCPNTLLILVPRHPERFNHVFRLAVKNGFNTVCRSHGATCDNMIEVFLGDTMGELMLFFAASDLAFVGGSLVDIGGHNVLEPASLGIATIIGPSYHHFAEVTKKLLDMQAIIKINNSQELATKVLYLLQDNDVRSELGKRGRGVIEQNRGALAMHLALLKELLLYNNLHPIAE